MIIGPAINSNEKKKSHTLIGHRSFRRRLRFAVAKSVVADAPNAVQRKNELAINFYVVEYLHLFWYMIARRSATVLALQKQTHVRQLCVNIIIKKW